MIQDLTTGEFVTVDQIVERNRGHFPAGDEQPDDTHADDLVARLVSENEALLQRLQAERQCRVCPNCSTVVAPA